MPKIHCEKCDSWICSEWHYNIHSKKCIGQKPWRRPTEKFKYTFEGKDSYYTPDFYIFDKKLYIEIKGYKVAKDEAKWSQFPLKLQVLMGKDLIELGLLDEKEVKHFPG